MGDERFANRPDPKVRCTGETKTEPEWARRVDLKAIAERFGNQMPVVPLDRSLFGDQVALDARDPQVAAGLVDARRKFFDGQPLAVRQAAGHSAEVFAQMVLDDDDLSTLTEAGLLLDLPVDSEDLSLSEAAPAADESNSPQSLAEQGSVEDPQTEPSV